MIFEILAPMTSHIKSGNLRALAVTTAQRSKFLPDVPTAAEQGLPEFQASGWKALFAPKGAPPCSSGSSVATTRLRPGARSVM